jgi:dTDP-4-amino-4,6-dideoxygalactose transaminase
MDTLQAAILRVKLRHIEKSTEGRRRAAQRYAELLEGVDGVVRPTERPGCRHSYHQYTIRVTGERRDAVKASLQARGIETMIYYPVPLHKLPIYQPLGLSLPRAERACTEVLSLPIWPEIAASTQERVVSELVRALRN